MDKINKIAHQPVPAHFTDQFNTLAENASSLIFVAQKGRFLYVNPAFARITGYAPHELYQMENAWDIIAPECRHLIKTRFMARENGKEVPSNYEIRLMTRDGETRWINYSGAAFEYAGIPAILGSGIDLTEHKKAEQSYRESELLYKAIFETSGTAMMIFQEDMLITLVNHEFEKLSGFAKKDIEHKKKWTEFIVEKDLPRMKSYHRQRRIDSTSVPANYEFQLLNRSGTIREIYITVDIIPGTKNSVCSFMDITDRKHSEEMLRQIIELLPDATFVINQAGEVIFWNKAIEEITSFTKEQMIGRGDYEYAIPFYGKRRAILIDRTLMSDPENERLSSQYDFVRREGDTIWGEIYVPKAYNGQGAYLWASASKLYDASGNIIGAIESIRDITNRKKVEAEREDLLALLQAMFNEHNAVMLLIEPISGRISDANPAACTFYGYSREELLKMDIQEINLLPKEKVDDLRLKALQQKQRYFLFPHRLKSGEIRLVDVYSCPLTHNGEIKLFSIIFDVTDRERYRKELYLEKELLRATLLSIGDGVFTTDARGLITSINNVAEQLTGWGQEEAIGQTMDEIFIIVNEYTRERCENPAYRVLETGNTVELANNALLISKEGIERPIEATATPIKGEDAQIKGVVLIFRDFTEKKERQEKIEYLSYHDQLTGLYNRRFFEEELSRLDTERNLPLTIIMGDINGLKLTNDAFGHMAGDKLLRKVAQVIKNSCRADDIIARFGGDEFIILLPQTRADEAKNLVNRINEVLLNENTSTIPLSISFGWETKRSVDQKMAEVFKKAEDHMYRRKLSESASMRNKTVKVIIKTLYEKNEREQQHSARVSQLCEALGKALGLSVEDISELKTVGLMHDIGKIILDDRILDKPAGLSDAEFSEIKRHAETGYRILSSVNEFAQLAEYVLAHHERWDGKGYPKGLQGEDIPLQARIIAIADSYDAMTSDRPYRKALNEEYAIEEIRRNSGTQFDPYITSVFLEKVL